MSSINPVTTPYPFPARTSAASATPPTRSAEATAQPGATTPADTADVTVDAIPSSPPAEVLDAMDAAGATQDRLAAGGQALHFSLDETTGKLTTQLTDLAGNVLGTVSPSGVLDIADGGSPS